MKLKSDPTKFLLQKKSGFSLVELMTSVAIVGVLAAMSANSYTAFVQKTHDRIRAGHLAEFNKMLLAEYADNESLPMTTTYGENSFGGWDTSVNDRNGNGRFFLDFLGPNQPVDPWNNATGDLWLGGGLGDLNAHAYQYYCYPVHVAGYWGSPNTNPMAVIITRTEQVNTIVFTRVDNVRCL
jgi:prepilin-type N-terminal cleavage/methylation domain-containing protein